jgi:hypothetical protein
MTHHMGSPSKLSRRSFAERIRRTRDDIAFEIDALYIDLKLAALDMSPMERASSAAALGLIVATLFPWVSFWETVPPAMDQSIHFPLTVAALTLLFALKRSGSYGRQKSAGVRLVNRRKALALLLLGNLSMVFSLGFVVHCLRVGSQMASGVDILFGYYCTVAVGAFIAFIGFFEFYKGAEFEPVD